MSRNTLGWGLVDVFPEYLSHRNIELFAIFVYEVFKNFTFRRSFKHIADTTYMQVFVAVVILRISESAVLPLANTVDAFLEELAKRFTLGKPQGTFTGIGIKMYWAIGLRLSFVSHVSELNVLFSLRSCLDLTPNYCQYFLANWTI